MEQLLRSAGIGLLASMRTVQPLAWLIQPKSQSLKNLFRFMAASEFGLDKMPFAGKRISPSQLTGRVISGLATVTYLNRKEPIRTRIEMGFITLLSTVAGTYALYHLRKSASSRLGIHDGIFGAIEDGMSLALGKLIQKNYLGSAAF